MNKILSVLYFTKEDERLVLDINSAQGVEFVIGERRGSGDADQFATIEFPEYNLVLRCEVRGTNYSTQKIRCVLEYDDGQVPDLFKRYVYYGND